MITWDNGDGKCKSRNYQSCYVLDANPQQHDAQPIGHPKHLLNILESALCDAMSSGKDRIRVPKRIGNWVIDHNLGSGYSGVYSFKRSDSWRLRLLMLGAMSTPQVQYGKRRTRLLSRWRLSKYRMLIMSALRTDSRRISIHHCRVERECRLSGRLEYMEIMITQVIP